MDQLCKKFEETVNKKNKGGIKVKAHQIKPEGSAFCDFLKNAFRILAEHIETKISLESLGTNKATFEFSIFLKDIIL